MLFDLAGAYETDPAYPFKKVWFTGYEPGGAEQMVKKFTDAVFPQMAAIIESACTPLGVRPDQVSRYFTYAPSPAEAYPAEQEYAQKIPDPPYGLGAAGGGVDIQKVALDAAKESAVKSISEAVVKQGATAAGMSAGQVAATTSGVALVAYAILNYKQIMASTNAKVTAGFGAATTLTALAIPVVGWIGAAVLVIKGVIDFKHGKKEMAKEVKRADELARSMQDVATILVDEAKALAEALAVRGLPLMVKPSPAFKTALWNHYLYLWVWEHRRKIKQQGTIPPLKAVVNVMRRGRLTMMLKCAADMRKLRSLVDQVPVLPADQAAEVVATARAISEKSPAVPYQVAVNAAQQVVQRVGGPLTPEARTNVATQVASAAQKQQTQEATAPEGGGLLPVATVVGTIALIMG